MNTEGGPWWLGVTRVGKGHPARGHGQGLVRWKTGPFDSNRTRTWRTHPYWASVHVRVAVVAPQRPITNKTPVHVLRITQHALHVCFLTKALLKLLGDNVSSSGRQLRARCTSIFKGSAFTLWVNVVAAFSLGRRFKKFSGIYVRRWPRLWLRVQDEESNAVITESVHTSVRAWKTRCVWFWDLASDSLAENNELKATTSTATIYTVICVCLITSYELDSYRHMHSDRHMCSFRHMHSNRAHQLVTRDIRRHSWHKL